MNKFLRISLGAIALGATLLAGAQTLYNPTRPTKDQGMALKSWGSGTIAETDETAFEGTTSIRVSSRNFFQGGIIDYLTPVDLGSAYTDKNNLLVFTLHIPGVIAGQAPSGKGSGKGGGKGAGGAGDLGLNNGEGSGGTTVTSTASLEKIRLVIATSDGMRSEAFVEVKGKVADEKGWMKASIPLQAISGFSKTNKMIQSIAIAGDAVSTFYVGEASISSDSTPIYGEINQGDLNLALGDVVQFIGSGYAGASPVKYEWDFDSTDGVQADASGQFVKRRFRKAGDFVVTLTISDMYGLKAPYSTTIKVTVNP